MAKRTAESTVEQLETDSSVQNPISGHRSLKANTSSYVSTKSENKHTEDDLLTWFRSLPDGPNINYLFHEEGVVLSIFRSLSPELKVTVLRLIDLQEPIRWEPVTIWQGHNRQRAYQTLSRLKSLRLLNIKRSDAPILKVPEPSVTTEPSINDQEVCAISNPAQTNNEIASTAGSSSVLSNARRGVSNTALRYELDKQFKDTLRLALLGISTGSLKICSSSTSKTPKHLPTKAQLFFHAAQRWKAVLEWLLSGQLANASEASSTSIMHRVLKAISSSSIPGHSKVLPINNSSSKTLPLSEDLIAVLCGLGLAPDHYIKDHPPVKVELTSQTFQWLLRDRRSQVLSICLEYLRSIAYGQCIAVEERCTSPDDPFGEKSAESSSALLTPDAIANNLRLISDPTPLAQTAASNHHRGFTVTTHQRNPVLLPVSSSIASRQSAEVLALLFTLSELLIGQPCSTTNLTPAQKRFLKLANTIGLVWMHKSSGAKHFFTTPFSQLLQANSSHTMHVTSIISNLSVLGSTEGQLSAEVESFQLPQRLFYPGYNTTCTPGNDPSVSSPTEAVLSTRESGVIVESNFKVFAYTSCPLLITVIVRLCEIRVITPSLIVGVLTRDTVREVYKTGVTAEQIVRFFTTHAHPSIYTKALREGRPVLPENVATQLCIWEEERRRVRMYKACILEFAKEQDLDIFPLVVARSQQWLIMHTECPPTTDVQSEQFKKWKDVALEQLKSRPQIGETFRAAAPVLAVHAQYKDELTNLVRASIRAARR